MFTSPFCLHRLFIAVIFLLLLLNGSSAITTEAQARAYVTNSCGNSVSVIDTDTNTIVATIPVGINPLGVTITPDGTRVYVTNQGSNTVSVIDAATNTVIATIPVGVPVPKNKDHCKEGGYAKFRGLALAIRGSASSTSTSMRSKVVQRVNQCSHEGRLHVALNSKLISRCASYVKFANVSLVSDM